MLSALEENCSGGEESEFFRGLREEPLVVQSSQNRELRTEGLNGLAQPEDIFTGRDDQVVVICQDSQGVRVVFVLLAWWGHAMIAASVSRESGQWNSNGVDQVHDMSGSAESAAQFQGHGSSGACDQNLETQASTVAWRVDQSRVSRLPLLATTPTLRRSSRPVLKSRG